MRNSKNGLKYCAFICIILLLTMCQSDKTKVPDVSAKALKQYLPNNGQEVGFIGTVDSLQCSLFLQRLTDSTLKYRLNIIKNWRYDWLDTEGVVTFDSMIPLKSRGNLYHDLDTVYNFQRHFAKNKNGEIFVYLGIGEARISVDFDNGKRKIALENSPLFWLK